MARQGLFIYGFIRATEDRATGLQGIEYDGAAGDVCVVALDGVGAVVSDGAPRDNGVMPTRRRLDSHNKVIREFLPAIIPMSFGQVVKSAAELKRVLKRRRAAILTELDRLAGKVEMSLRVRWDVENIFECFVEEDRELAGARDRVFRAGTPTHAEKLELGRLFEERLGEERSKQTERVMELVRPATADVKVNPPKGEKTVMELVALVPSASVEDFERRVYAAAEAFPSQYTFDFNGPWAPFSFVQLSMQP